MSLHHQPLWFRSASLLLEVQQVDVDKFEHEYYGFRMLVTYHKVRCSMAVVILMVVLMFSYPR